MYTQEQIKRAIDLLINYDFAYTQVIRELGYPSRASLYKWYKEYEETGNMPNKYSRKPKYSLKEKKAAVDYYIKHGKNISRTIRILGYPSRPLLSQWIDELAPNEKRHCLTGGSLIKYPQDFKVQAVASLCTREKPAKEIANDLGVSREVLYKWQKKLMEEGILTLADKDNKNDKVTSKDLQAKNKELQDKVSKLEDKLYRLHIEHDVLEKAIEIIKKDKGINLKTLTNREKAMVINVLRDKYKLKDLLLALNMAKSSYCYQVVAIKQGDKYSDLREQVIEVFHNSYKAYGYRRIHSKIKASGKTISEKVIRKIMHEEKLVTTGRKRRNYSSYKGEISPAVDNLIARDFNADKINQKWVTDLSEFHIPAGKVYLSPMIDCFDELPITWSISTSPNAELTNSMLDAAISTLKDGEHPIVHSDRGAHYHWPGWIKKMNEAKLIRSMSKKGCSPDNAACEGFFGRVKNEFFYSRTWEGISIKEFIDELDKYLRWYGEERIKMSLGGMSPMDYRFSLGLVS